MNQPDIEQLAKACADHIHAESGLTVSALLIAEYIERAIAPLQQELNVGHGIHNAACSELLMRKERASELESELAELRKAFELQRRNYIDLHDAVMGEGCTTSDVKDICAIARELRKDRERIDWLNARSGTLFAGRLYVAETEHLRAAIDAAMKGNP